LPIKSICINSKQASKHSLFFGLPGENTDGSKYFEEALAKEAALCIIKHGFIDQKNHTALLECEDVLFTMTELSRLVDKSLRVKLLESRVAMAKPQPKKL